MSMSIGYLAWRIVDGVGVQPGELVMVMDHAGRDDLLRAVVLAIETAGATPLPEIAPPEHVATVLKTAKRDHLEMYDRRRAKFMRECDRIIVLTGGYFDADGVPPESLAAWSAAQARLAEIEEAKRTPNLVVAVPTAVQAQRLGMTLPDLEGHLAPALTAPVLDIQNALIRMRYKLAGRRIIIRSGEGHELRLDRGDRPMLSDDGYIDEEDRALGAVVSNLPAGSVYFTVLEGSATGSLHLPQAGPARDVVLRFEHGKVAHLDAAEGADALAALFDAHTGEPRRISHIGVGLNPYLRQAIGWTLVDEHVYGSLFIAFGENRYMGGQNASSLNEDFALPKAKISAQESP
jgi:leucyl aminopeptidase (aminopeptidase T)